ncbi:MAG: MarR family transcriptional regulator [Clostridia bacterium]|nr:MarR family transcriptional regulator [Clostridia bacterium]MBQ8368395.1 MarR family transcriptional regulator [Clostridia bacterium]
MNKKQIDILNDYFLHSALHMMTLEEQCLRRVCAEDLSVRELHVIEAVSVLQTQHKNTMAEIAKYLHLSPASLTTAVNTLVRKEYLEREYSPTDRRVIYVETTERGAEANRKYLDFVRKMIWYISRDIDEQTSDTMIEAIMKLSEFLESGGDPADLD